MGGHAGLCGFFHYLKFNKMGKQRLITYTCNGEVIEEFFANYSDTGLPKKGGTFSLQKNVAGEIKSLRYLIEAVFVSDDRVQCDCLFIGYSG